MNKSESSNHSYLDELNAVQREAVLYTEGPSLVIAGAGSGKTRVLTYKVTHLLEQGMMPWNILALTFTNKAAREMRERVSKQVGATKGRQLFMGTFHSVFSRILREHAEYLGFSSNFTIYDGTDSKNLIKSIIRELGLDEKKYKPRNIQQIISRAKDKLISPEDYQSNKELVESDNKADLSAIGEIYSIYWNRCRRTDVMDFDDLLVNTFILLNQHRDVLDKYQHQFQYILVDEYQDTNHVQHEIVRLLAEAHRRICVVGDDAQSIYSFRGANVDNILNFQSVFEGTKLFKLEQNYRSTQTIVMAANSLIEKNKRQIHKEVYSKNATGEALPVIVGDSDIDESYKVSRRISSLVRNEGIRYDEIAVLYRTNAQSRAFEKAFRDATIPYQIYGGTSFYQRAEIKDAVAYMRLAINPRDEEALKRVINKPKRAIGKTSQDRCAVVALTKGISLWEVVSDPFGYEVGNGKAANERLVKFSELIFDFKESAKDLLVDDWMRNMFEKSGLMAAYATDDTPEGISHRENLEELLNSASAFVAQRQEYGDTDVLLSDFLSEISLMTDQDQGDDGDTNKVTLMTIHAAKGLEYPCVFVVGLEEELLPSRMSMDTPRQVEEERRLFYVALTRAEKYCFLSYANSRFQNGRPEFHAPSRFLEEINADLLSWSGRPRGIRRQANQLFAAHGEGTMDENRGKRGIRPNWDHDAPERFGRRRTTNERKRIPDEALFTKGLSNMTKIPHVKTSKVVAGMTNSSAEKSSSPTSTTIHTGIGESFELTVGTRIRHNRFGEGTVVETSGEGPNAKATIHFENYGKKQLLLRFARLEKLV